MRLANAKTVASLSMESPHTVQAEPYAKARAALWNSLLELTCIHLEMERYDVEQIKPQNSYILDLLLDDLCWNFIVKQCKRLPPQSVVSTYILPFGNSVFI